MQAITPEFLARHMDQIYFRRVREDWGGNHLFLGRSPGPGSVFLSSNDYLGLARHPDVVRAQVAAFNCRRPETLMSSVFLEHDGPHEQLEQELAKFLGYDAVLLCQSGWSANFGLVQSIAGPEIPVYFDLMAHTSFREGITSAGARAIPFRPNDVEHMCAQIRRGGPGVVLVESVYSTHGSLCPLPELTQAAAERGCVVVVDESHSLGTHGTNGEGLVASVQLQPWVHFVTASLSKAFAGRAGLIACAPSHREYLRFTSFPAIFSSAVLQHDVAALRAILPVIKSATDRRQRLHRHAQSLRAGLDGLGYAVSSGTEQIIALEPGTEPLALVLREALESRAIFGAVFCPPATAKNRALMRLSVHSDLTDDELERVLAVCAEIRDEIRLGEWRSTRRRRAQG